MFLPRYVPGDQESRDHDQPSVRTGAARRPVLGGLGGPRAPAGPAPRPGAGGTAGLDREATLEWSDAYRGGRCWRRTDRRSGHLADGHVAAAPAGAGTAAGPTGGRRRGEAARRPARRAQYG